MEIIFVVTKKVQERRTVLKEGFKCYTLPVRGFLGKSYLERMVFPFFVTVSMILFAIILVKRRPRAIVGTGGYASFVPLFLGILFGIPTLISEQDSYPGLSTRILSRYVSEVHVAHGKAKLYMKAKKAIITGNPIRNSIFEGTREEAIEYFNLDKKKKTVFIVGGSHGARSINRVFVEVMKKNDFPTVQFIFQTGEDDFMWVTESLKGVRVVVRIFPFIEQMNLAYAAADLIFSRAGALTLAEITARGVPSVLIPYPYATAGHQEENARFFEKVGASVVLLDSELSYGSVENLIYSLLMDEKRLSTMSKKAQLLCKKDAAKKIAVRVLSLSEGVENVP